MSHDVAKSESNQGGRSKNRNRDFHFPTAFSAASIAEFPRRSGEGRSLPAFPLTADLDGPSRHVGGVPLADVTCRLKAMHCGDVIKGCNFVARGATEDEMMKKAAKHAKSAHVIDKTSEAIRRKALRSIKLVFGGPFPSESEHELAMLTALANFSHAITLGNARRGEAWLRGPRERGGWGSTMKRLDRSGLATLCVLGMLSGGVAWGLIMLTTYERPYLSKLKGGADVGIYEMRLFPGLIFGLVIGFLWHRRGMASHRVVLGYMLASMLAHFLAFEFAFNMFERSSGVLPERLDLALIGIIAGLIGCCILGLATIFLLRVSYRSALGLPVLVGGAAGALLPLIDLYDGWSGGWLLFYVLWQGAYAASLVRLLQPGFAAAGKAASSR